MQTLGLHGGSALVLPPHTMPAIHCRISQDAKDKLDTLREHYKKKHGVSQLSYPRLIELMATTLLSQINS